MKIFASMIIMFSFLVASESTWKKDMSLGLNWSQTSFENWVAGGENTVNWQLNYDFKFERGIDNFKQKYSGKMNFGTSKIGDGDARKSADELKLESVFIYLLGVKINPYLALNFDSQIAPGYNYDEEKEKISEFLNPGIFRESMGFGYKFSKYADVRAGLTFKQSMTTVYGEGDAEDESTTENETGMEVVGNFNYKLNDNTRFESKITLFSELKDLDETVVDWEFSASTNASKYIQVTLQANLFYDEKVSTKRQLKQALMLGFSYNFFAND